MAKNKTSVGSFVMGLLIAALIGVALGLLIVNPSFSANSVKPAQDSGKAVNYENYDDKIGKLDKPVKKANVTHILVKVGASTKEGGKNRTEAEAKKRAEEIWKQYYAAPEAERGKVWYDLQEQYNEDGQPHTPFDVDPNARLVQGFKDVSLTTEVGMARIAPYNKDNSPYGFHIIRRER